VKTLLDLIQEYATLSEAKTLAGGVLPPESENRWSELNKFYDLLMLQDGYCAQPASRFTADNIRQTVSTRSRLRVHTDMEIVVIRESDYHRARVGNLSCGGVLLLCDSLLDIASRVTLNLANITRGEGVVPADGDVVWLADRGSTNGTFRYRMGLSFIDLGQSGQQRLDTLVVDSLENKLLSLSRDALDAEFVRREQLVL
jgi:hypothetical protein